MIMVHSKISPHFRSTQAHTEVEKFVLSHNHVRFNFVYLYMCAILTVEKYLVKSPAACLKEEMSCNHNHLPEQQIS